MIRVSRSPLKFLQATSKGRRDGKLFRRGQVSLSPEMPRYSSLSTVSHRRVSHLDPVRRFY